MDNEVKIICKQCGKSTTGIIKEIEYTLREGRYIGCMHCGKKIEYPYKGYVECMKERCYRRENGVMKQIRNK